MQENIEYKQLSNKRQNEKCRKNNKCVALPSLRWKWIIKCPIRNERQNGHYKDERGRIWDGNMQGMSSRNDSVRMNHMWMSMNQCIDTALRMMQRRMPMNNREAMRMNRIRHMREYGMRGRYMHHPDYGMGRNNFRGPMAMGQMRHDRFIDNIPNLTDAQKKEIADLHQKQMTEMNKLRQESFEKMKSLREANRSKMMNILTDDQKKWIESSSSSSKNNVTKNTKK